MVILCKRTEKSCAKLTKIKVDFEKVLTIRGWSCIFNFDEKFYRKLCVFTIKPVTIN